MIKKLLQLLVFSALSLSLLMCSQRASAQGGSYRRAPANDSEVTAAADYAAREIGRKLGKTVSLISIMGAQKQVVAGTNYKVCVKLKVDGKVRGAQAVIYRNSQQQFSLKSWGWGNCKM